MKSMKPTYQELTRQIAKLQIQNELLLSNSTTENTSREYDEKFKKVFDSNPVAIIITTIGDGIILDCNDALTELSGYCRNELISNTVEELNFWIKPKKRDDFIDATLKVDGKRKHEINFRTKYGNIINTQVSAESISFNGVICLLSVIEDITERKKAEEVLKESKTKLKNLNATKDKLFSIIAHDLRSPFNGILGLSEILIESGKDFEVEKTDNYLDLIKSSAEKTLVLLDNLLNWAKSQSGQINFKPQKIVLSSIIHDIIATSNSIAKVKNISINYIQSENIVVSADLEMLNTVLRNLISNAIKFTDLNGNIEIYSRQTLNEIEIRISDNGVGMDKETVNQLFNLNENLKSVGTANEKGSGLGLILSKEFVEKHKGKIWVESELGKGSDFKFTLSLN